MYNQLENKVFLDWSFNVLDGTLSCNSQTHRLAPLQSKLLHFLISHAGELISREDFIEHLWPNKVVNDDALSRNIAQLRNMLGDDKHNPLYIETVPKRGYRFVAPLSSQSISEEDVLKKGRFSQLSLYLWAAFVVCLCIVFYWLYSTGGKRQVHWIDSINNAHLLTADELVEYQPSISNDGRLVSFAYKKRDWYGVKVIDTQGSVILDLYEKHSQFLSPRLSPDNQYLLVARFNSQGCNVTKVTISTGNKQDLTSCKLPSESNIFDWSIDSKRFLFVDEDENGRAVIWQYLLDEQLRQQLSYAASSNEFDSDPKWTLSGINFSFSRGNYSVRNVWQGSVENSSSVKQLTFLQSMILSHTWVSDDQFLFDSNIRGNKNLWLMELKDKQAINLGAKDGQFADTSSSLDRLIFQEKRYQINLWHFDVSNNKRSKIVSSAKSDQSPQISPDHKTLAYTTNRFGDGEIWQYDFETGQESLILKLDKHSLNTPKWHPTKKKMLISFLNSRRSGCLEINLLTKRFSIQSSDELSAYRCTYHPDGKILAQTKQEGDIKSSDLVTLDKNGNISNRLVSNISNFKVTHKGKIFYTLNDANGLFELEEYKTSKILIPDFNKHYAELWTVNDLAVFYSDSLSEQPGIKKFDLKSGHLSFITDFVTNVNSDAMTVSSNGLSLVISRLDKIESDVYITELISN